MLSLIRDYFKSTLLFYKNLYMNASTYGIKKELDSSQSKDKIREDISDLENNIKLAESEVAELKEKIRIKRAEFIKQNEVF